MMETKNIARFLVSCLFSVTVIHLTECMPSSLLSAHQHAMEWRAQVDEDYHAIPLLGWALNKDQNLLSSHRTLTANSDYNAENRPSFRVVSKRGLFDIKNPMVNNKRKSHQVARIFMTPSAECLIIDSKGTVSASKKQTTCESFGRFCHKVSGSTLQLKNIKTGKYLAVNNKGLIYSTDDAKSKDTILSDVIANHNNFSIYIYKEISQKKCYIDATSNALFQRCSFAATPLKPQLRGICT